MSIIELDFHDRIATVSINRSERRNAVNRELMYQLEEVCKRFRQDEETRAVIINAKGKDFSVGADLSDPQHACGTMLMNRRASEFGAQLMRAMQEIPQPTICAVQGIATGAGACIASACDFRIGAENARIGYGEAKMGMNLKWHALPLCVHLVGPARAKQMIMTGQLFDAPTLERWGFLDKVVPVSDVDNAAREMASVYAALPPNGVQMIKKSINQVSGALDAAIMHMDADQFLLAISTNDHNEAISAFFDKRVPQFTGN